MEAVRQTAYLTDTSVSTGRAVLLELVEDESGDLRCNGCGACGHACPTDAIAVERVPGPTASRDRSAGLYSFRVDEMRCIACGACIGACRRAALAGGPDFNQRRAEWRRLADTPPRLVSGHRLCAGCGASVVVRQVLSRVKGHYVAAVATGCLQVSTTLYPYSSWSGSCIHAGFENAAATLSGVESAYRALERRKGLPEGVTFIAFAGDGGTYDIGLQALSGAMERGHKMLFVCYDNGAYMNTGFQRSGSTPLGAWTTTSPVGRERSGKAQHRKNMTEIMASHGIPYAAQASPHDPRDLMSKVDAALAADGPAFLNILSPCPRGWRAAGDLTIALARLATECCFWPLYEVIDGTHRLTYRPTTKRPLRDWLEPQGRFSHLMRPEAEAVLGSHQEQVDREWKRLLKHCEEPPEADRVPTTACSACSAVTAR
jgi:pyruvate ferredoxin oxidoreductase beta subunit